jgi:hypothetical protein
MNALARSIVPLIGSVAILLPAARGADIVKANNADALNLGTSWTGGIVPGPGDTLLWNNTSFTAGAIATGPQLGANLSLLGIRITNPPGAANAAATGVAIQNTGSANTLTIGSGGFDLSAATQALLVQSKVTLSANQNWVIANANTNGSPFGLNNGEGPGVLRHWRWAQRWTSVRLLRQ